MNIYLPSKLVLAHQAKKVKYIHLDKLKHR